MCTSALTLSPSYTTSNFIPSLAAHLSTAVQRPAHLLTVRGATRAHLQVSGLLKSYGAFECACGTDANLTPTCTGTATDTVATPDCAAAFASAGDALAASCPEGCTHFATPDWFSGTADCFPFGDSWDQTTHCCACRADSMTCEEGDYCEDPHAHSALLLCADSHARSASSAGAQDGDYTLAGRNADGSLPGFWPEFTDSLVTEFKNFYGDGRGSVSLLASRS